MKLNIIDINKKGGMNQGQGQGQGQGRGRGRGRGRDQTNIMERGCRCVVTAHFDDRPLTYQNVNVNSKCATECGGTGIGARIGDGKCAPKNINMNEDDFTRFGYRGYKRAADNFCNTGTKYRSQTRAPQVYESGVGKENELMAELDEAYRKLKNMTESKNSLIEEFNTDIKKARSLYKDALNEEKAENELIQAKLKNSIEEF